MLRCNYLKKKCCNELLPKFKKFNQIFAKSDQILFQHVHVKSLITKQTICNFRVQIANFFVHFMTRSKTINLAGTVL